MIVYDFNHVPTVRAFFLDRRMVKCIMGPLGSGKSSGCVVSLFHYACMQKPDERGIRRTRFTIVRNTYKELMDTTKKTIDEWIGPMRPVWKEGKFMYEFSFRLADGTRVHSEWLLRALDRPEDIRRILSSDLSGAWVNEAREVGKEIIDMLEGRIGRYPGKRQCTYAFILMDTNPPDVGHWLYQLFEKQIVEDPSLGEKYVLFRQPSGLAEDAENIANLPENYYRNLVIGKDPDWVKVYVHGEYGYTKEGKPVFPNFAPSVHIAKERMSPIKGLELAVGMDFGLFPAAVIGQLSPKGELRVYDEIVSMEATDISEFVEGLLMPFMRTQYGDRILFYVIGDPAGRNRSQLDSRSCFMVLRGFGINAYPAYSNSLQPRLQAVNGFLTRLVEGKPAFQINPNCETLIAALSGKYRFRRVRVSGEHYSDLPEKNSYSHVADALQYLAMGAIPRRQIEVEDNGGSARISIL